MATPNQRADFLTRLRAATRLLLQARETIDALTEFNAQTGIAASLSDADFLVGEHAGLTKAEIVAAAQTLVAFDASLKAGSPSNLSKLMAIS